jgi:hypothetical protein
LYASLSIFSTWNEDQKFISLEPDTPISSLPLYSPAVDDENWPPASMLDKETGENVPKC